jgi:hypothetical protein
MRSTAAVVAADEEKKCADRGGLEATFIDAFRGAEKGDARRSPKARARRRRLRPSRRMISSVSFSPRIANTRPRRAPCRRPRRRSCPARGSRPCRPRPRLTNPRRRPRGLQIRSAI